MVYFRGYAGVLLVACPGTGVSGLPRMPCIRCGGQRSPSGLRRTVATLNTPTLVPMRFSLDRISNPSHTPSSQASSNLPGIILVLGILKCTVSPNSAIWDSGCLPRILCIEVWPSGRTRQRVISAAACRMSHGTMFIRSRTFSPILSSKADLSVRICPSTSWMARSTDAFELESPTSEFSMAVP